LTAIVSGVPPPRAPSATGEIVQREVVAGDIELFFEQQLDPEANRMAAFVAADPSDRAAFERKWVRILGDDTTVNRTIFCDGQVAGHVSCWRDPELAHPEVTYWLGREFWGRGVATQALRLFLAQVWTQRPVYGRVVRDNVGSLRVLEKCGFTIVGADHAFANARGETVEELLLELPD
jgi:RimJ/RimL family protein N-acetyltransferase